MSVADLRDLGAELCELNAKLEGLYDKREMFDTALKKVAEEEALLNEKLANQRKQLAAAEENASAASERRSRKSKKNSKDPRAQAIRKLIKKRVPRDTGVVVSMAQFHPLLEQLPTEPRIPPLVETLACVHTIQGPGFTDATIKMDEFAAGRTITTYPLVADRSHRQGQPICDRFYVEMSRGRTLLAIADGCNWGDRPLEAATKALQGFVSHASLNLDKITDPRAAGAVLLDSLSTAHNAIIAGKNNVWDAGTTTLLGGILFPLEHSGAAEGGKATTTTTTTTSGGAAKEYGLVLLNIGDCKCYLFNHKSRRVREITRGNRGVAVDASDPGGRLGPYVGNGQPDLRNLSIYFEKCHPDDIVIICSDGVHDNLDPAMLGVSPEEVVPEFTGMTWDQACECNPELGSVARTVFAEKRLELLLGKQLEKTLADELEVYGEQAFLPSSRVPIPCHASNLPPSLRSNPSLSPLGTDTTTPSNAGSNVFVPAPDQIVSMITEYCLRVTENSRAFMEANPRDTQPKDLKRFPGKMDHTTCVAVRVAFPEDQLQPPEKEVFDLLKIAKDHPLAIGMDAHAQTPNI